MFHLCVIWLLQSFQKLMFHNLQNYLREFEKANLKKTYVGLCLRNESNLYDL